MKPNLFGDRPFHIAVSIWLVVTSKLMMNDHRVLDFLNVFKKGLLVRCHAQEHAEGHNSLRIAISKAFKAS